MLVAAQDTVTDSLCKKYTWQQENTEIMCTLFFCFEWPQIGEESALGCRAGKCVNYDFYLCFACLNHCVEFIPVSSFCI